MITFSRRRKTKKIASLLRSEDFLRPRVFRFKKGTITVYPTGAQVARSPIGVKKTGSKNGIVTKIYHDNEEELVQSFHDINWNMPLQFKLQKLLASKGAPIAKPISTSRKMTKVMGGILVWQEEQLRGVNLDDFLRKSKANLEERKKAVRAFEEALIKLKNTAKENGIYINPDEAITENAIYNPKKNKVIFIDIQLSKRRR